MTTTITARPTLVDLVAQRYRQDVNEGLLKPGAALPSTRKIAKALGVSSYTTACAMQKLAEEGIVVSLPRAGRMINPDLVLPVALPPGTEIPDQRSGPLKTRRPAPSRPASDPGTAVLLVTNEIAAMRTEVRERLTRIESLLTDLGRLGKNDTVEWDELD